MAIALESGGDSLTVSAVAKRAGISRTSVYEYFASIADIAADLVLDDLNSFAVQLSEISSLATTEMAAIDVWIQESLGYIADGRHMLAKAFYSMDFPQNRAAEIKKAHGALLAPLRANLQTIGINDVSTVLTLLQGATDGATKRIESGDDPAIVIKQTRDFCIAGVKALAPFKAIE